MDGQRTTSVAIAEARDSEASRRRLEPQLRSRMLSTADQVSVADHRLVRSSADARSQLRPHVSCCKQDRGKYRFPCAFKDGIHVSQPAMFKQILLPTPYTVVAIET